MTTTGNLTNFVRRTLRAAGRPLVGAIRNALTPGIAPTKWQYCTIEQGPASGCEIRLPIPSELSVMILSYQYETYSMRLLEKIIAKNDVCYDIGGHYGAFTLNMARLANEGEVHTFEPVAALAENIGLSIKKSGLDNAHIHHVALAGKSGTMTMRSVSDESGDDSMAYLEEYGGVLTPRSIVQYANFQDVTVSCVTLDNVTTSPPDFIKMDVEGAEFAVITGGKKLLSTSKPRILMEVHGVETALRCANFLQSFGYQAWQIAPIAMAPQILWLHQSDTAGRTAIADLTDPAASLVFGDAVETPS